MEDLEIFAAEGTLEEVFGTLYDGLEANRETRILSVALDFSNPILECRVDDWTLETLKEMALMNLDEGKSALITKIYDRLVLEPKLNVMFMIVETSEIQNYSALVPSSREDFIRRLLRLLGET